MILYLIFIISFIIIYIYYDYKNEISYNKLKYLNFRKYNLKPSSIKYVCWTGGFDSTFLVCNYISKGYTVQPIYLDFKNLDDIYFPLIQTKRKNSKIEINKMKELRNLVINKFKAPSKLLPTKIITKQKPDRNILEIMNHIHMKYNLFTRKTNQYERIIEVAYHYKIPLEIGAQKTTSNDFYRLKKKGFIKKTNNNYEIIQDLPSHYRLLGILNTLRFPIIDLSKHDMLTIAKQNQFDHILKQTWSCWFPVYSNEKYYPCGKCYMCKERII